LNKYFEINSANKEQGMNKNILQSVSGGYDSAWLLIKNLQNHDNVYPVYIYSSCINTIKQRIENTVANDLIVKLQQRFDNLHDLTEITINMNNVKGIYSTQPILWCLGLFSEIQNKRYISYDEAHIAYIMRDSAISLQTEIQAFWKSLFSFSWPLPDYTVPALKFPLVKYSKDIIIQNLRNFDDSIAESLWTCERPRILRKKKLKNGDIEAYIEPCGVCHTCGNLRNVYNISFDSLRKYRAVFHASDWRTEIDKLANKIIRNRDLDRIHKNHVELETADAKIIDAIHKKLEQHETTEKTERLKCEGLSFDRMPVIYEVT
jgi:7-cyano-7-deazaguanine synthase in queuosine biosynthesis